MSEGLIELLSKNIIIGSCSRDSLITMIFISKTNFWLPYKSTISRGLFRKRCKIYKLKVIHMHSRGPLWSQVIEEFFLLLLFLLLLFFLNQG